MAKTKKSELSLAIVTDSVPDALGALKKELAGLKQIAETQYKTGTSGKVDGFTNAIQDETSIEVLTKMHSCAYGKSNAYNGSQARLAELMGGKFTGPTFKMNGSTFDNIEEDIVLRIKVLSITQRKQKLEGLIKEAEQFLTEKDKFKLFQARLKAELGGQTLENAAGEFTEIEQD